MFPFNYEIDQQVPDGLLTATYRPMPLKDRHRRVMRNYHETCRAFVGLLQPEARCGNLICEDGVAFSYGGHHPFCRIVLTRRATSFRDLFVLFRSGRVSPATGRHYNVMNFALINSELKDRVHRVPDVMADTEGRHAENREWLEGEAETRAAYTFRQYKVNRHHGAEYSLTVFRRACAYALAVGLDDVPALDTPAGVLADWLREHRPKLVKLAAAVASLCPLTGTSLSPPLVVKTQILRPLPEAS